MHRPRKGRKTTPGGRMTRAAGQMSWGRHKRCGRRGNTASGVCRTSKGIIMNMEVVWNFLRTQGADFGFKILGAIAAWIVGRWLIGIAVRLIGAALEKGKKIDATLYAVPQVHHLGAADADPGAGHPGHLRHQDHLVRPPCWPARAWPSARPGAACWATLRPACSCRCCGPTRWAISSTAGGTLGTVKELGLFATTVLTPDNVLTVVGNNKVFLRQRAELQRRTLPPRGLCRPRWPTASTCWTPSPACAR